MLFIRVTNLLSYWISNISEFKKLDLAAAGAS